MVDSALQRPDVTLSKRGTIGLNRIPLHAQRSFFLTQNPIPQAGEIVIRELTTAVIRELTTFWNVFQVFEAFFKFAEWKSRFWSVFKFTKRKSVFEAFPCLQNEKIRKLLKHFYYYKMEKNMFFNRVSSLQNEKHVFEAFFFYV